MESNKPRRIGYYMSQSKLARLPWAEITAIALYSPFALPILPVVRLIDCFIFIFIFSNFATHRAKGCELVAVDLERDIAEQGPFDMLLYKVRIHSSSLSS
jgi:hypothetical protein